jgi:NCAIR mutase (PurE)-related protein
MNKERLRKLLRAVQDGDVTAGEAMRHLQNADFEDIGFAKLDVTRQIRCGLPEAIFCQGKTVEQVAAIAKRMLGHGVNILATRATEEMHRAVAALARDAVFHPEARAVVVKRTRDHPPVGEILVVCAGTADVPVAEEARVTAEFLDNKVRAVHDVGVAGLHRLLRHQRELRRANVIIVVAGMEGALASVVGGMVARPVIAVPTSVGYGASFSGIAPLLTMLNSCAAGVAVVNIDNGFGAGCVASLINHTGCRHESHAKGS